MSEADTVPDDVRKLADKFATEGIKDGGLSSGYYSVRETIADAIMADRAAWNRRAPIAGMVMVPVEPTGAMIDLGAQVIDPSGVFGLTWEECCERAQAVLRAVLVASTKEG